MASEDPPNLHRLDGQGSAGLELVEPIRHPHFWWPRTLVTYRLAYDPAVTDPTRLVVEDDAGAVMPYQVGIPGPGATCTVSFLTDLPTGGRRSFRVKTLAHPSTPPSPAMPVTVMEDQDTVILGTGCLRLRMPRVLGSGVPGPIQGFDDGRGWIGTSRLIVPGRTVSGLSATILERGALRSRVRLSYTFAEGGSYAITFTAKSGYDFIETDEDMVGLPADLAARVEIDWTGFHPTRRRGNEPIDQPKILYFRGEDPHFTGPGGVEDPTREMYVRVAPSNADSTINTVAIDFTDPAQQRAIGVAVRDAAGWDDGTYALWASNEVLALRFRHAAGLLTWTLPLATGHRSLSIAGFNPQATAAPLERDDEAEALAVANTGRAPGRSRIDLIASRYAGMSLDVVKDWRLTYDDALPHPSPGDLPHQDGKFLKTPTEYLAALWGAKNEALKPEGAWVSPVGLRVMNAWIVPGFDRFRDALPADERKRVTALLLFHAYYAAREEVAPVRRLLKGHPNFMADWKYPLMAGAALFPRHPLAQEWGQQFEKTLDLMGTFWVRPPVTSWEALGGRWTESIAVYNWAFWEPTLRANALGRRFDGRERVANPGLAQHGDYLVGIATAPVRLGKDDEPLSVAPGTALTAANGFQRIHPAQGAHGGRRAIPGSAEELAQALQRYRPLTAEHLRWLAQRPGTAAGNHGTNPRLTSAKYTGYGIVLRAAVDTPDEISVFLQQIDKGPNYRWGFANEGGCGDIYYYAAGRSFSGHLGEDTGDRRATDAELTCNTGVYKDQTFRGIGMNDLQEPFYDLESAQYAEIRSRSGPDAYSWPEYQARAALLVGSDYLLTFDVLNGCSRTAWSTLAGQDAKPTLIPLRGENAFTVHQEVGGKGHAAGSADITRFDCYKGGGDRVLLVSHKTAITAKDRRNGVTEVTVAAGTRDERRDVVFLQREEFTVEDPDLTVSGRAAVVRTRKGGPTELVLFHGHRLTAQGYTLEADHADLGVSAVVTSPTEMQGRAFSRSGGTLVLTRPAGAATLALNGQILGTVTGTRVSLTFPPGAHRWQLTAGPVEPMPAEITASEARADGVQITVPTSASATRTVIERSDDGGLTWVTVGETTDGLFNLRGVTPPAKLHLRAVAANGPVLARPGRDFPVVVTGVPVPPPAGLRVVVPAAGRVVATWGQVLGASSYRLYRQTSGSSDWTEIYRGPAFEFTDLVSGAVPAVAEPGQAAAWRQPAPEGSVIRYAVRAVDGIGEGDRSEVVSTDPTSWAAWMPATSLEFKRQTAYWLPPYVRPEQVPPAAYPP